jgi:DNA polymerase-3 subunit gamma/tau
MSYQVLARKWRPRNFTELVGQEHVRRALINALDHDRLHHAYLFTGTRGVGKTTIARIFAKSLNCEEGVGSTPCGICSACEEIDGGRFVDLVEVDAASRTKVEDTRELLENVQYAPTRGRYKVYLIDEVHMLSGHSFNALLKTLEEPPPHVKFLLATTDPQKLPVTILSRCLQFNLKRLTVPQISAQLESILEQEKIKAEEGAIRQLAFSADGSLRDALSLLDQAIAYCSGALVEDEVRAMLGTIDRDAVYRILNRLADNDVAGLLDEIRAADEFAPDYEALLADLLSILQRVALAQALTDAVDDSFGDRDAVLGLAEGFSPEDVQLYYQIGLIGRRDLPLSPDPRAGFEMVMLRMLAFRPGELADSGRDRERGVSGSTGQAGRTGKEKPVAPAAPVTPPRDSGSESGQWEVIVEKLALKGLTHQLAVNCALQEITDTGITLTVDPSHMRLLSKARSEQIKKALCQFYGHDVRLKILKEGTPQDETPARRQAREQENRQQQAIESIESDENIKAFQDTFGATVNYDSIRPRD